MIAAHRNPHLRDSCGTTFFAVERKGLSPAVPESYRHSVAAVLEVSPAARRSGLRGHHVTGTASAASHRRVADRPWRAHERMENARLIQQPPRRPDIRHLRCDGRRSNKLLVGLPVRSRIPPGDGGDYFTFEIQAHGRRNAGVEVQLHGTHSLNGAASSKSTVDGRW